MGHLEKFVWVLRFKFFLNIQILLFAVVNLIIYFLNKKIILPVSTCCSLILKVQESFIVVWLCARAKKVVRIQFVINQQSWITCVCYCCDLDFNFCWFSTGFYFTFIIAFSFSVWGDKVQNNSETAEYSQKYHTQKMYKHKNNNSREESKSLLPTMGIKKEVNGFVIYFCSNVCLIMFFCGRKIVCCLRGNCKIIYLFVEKS